MPQKNENRNSHNEESQLIFALELEPKSAPSVPTLHSDLMFSSRLNKDVHKEEQETNRRNYLKKANDHFEVNNYPRALKLYQDAILCRSEHQSRNPAANIFEIAFDIEDTDIWSKIAYCYKHMHNYQQEYACLKKINLQDKTLHDIQQRIINCETQLCKLLPNTHHVHQYIRKVQSWDSMRNRFVEMAGEILSQHEHKKLANPNITLIDINKIITLYKEHHNDPSPVEKKLYTNLESLQTNLQKQIKDEKHTALQSIHKAIAEAAEKKIAIKTEEAKSLLKAGKLDDALAVLISAKNIANDINSHPEHFNNKNYRDPKYFGGSIWKLQEKMKNYQDQAKNKPLEYATQIVKNSMNSNQTLLYRHNERIIDAMAQAMRSCWYKFHGKEAEEFNALFGEMSKLIRCDQEKMSLLMCLKNRSWDSVRLIHSQAIGFILQEMIEAHQVTTIQCMVLPIFPTLRIPYVDITLLPASIQPALVLLQLQDTLKQWESWERAGNHDLIMNNRPLVFKGPIYDNIPPLPAQEEVAPGKKGSYSSSSESISTIGSSLSLT